MGKRIRHDYTEEFKLEVMSYFCSHREDRIHTCERFGLNKSTLKDWVNKYVYGNKDVSLHHHKTRMALHCPLSSLSCQVNQYGLPSDLVCIQKTDKSFS